MKGIRLLKRLAAALRKEDYCPSYAQCGEDRILHFLFSLLKITHPSYLDIGAHHPTYLSNTFLFYREGSDGVCVEPDPHLCRRIKIVRPRDKCLNIGIAAAAAADTIKFYVFDDPTMNTFSEAVKQQQLVAGRILKQELQINVESVNAIIGKHFAACPNLVSLDTEGLDLDILMSFDFATHRPEVFCIETLTNVGERKMKEIIDYMESKEFTVYADTFINTIFVDQRRWSARTAGLALAPMRRSESHPDKILS